MKSAIANTWLRPAPDTSPDRQILIGDHFEVTQTQGEFSFGRALKDDYAGCVLTKDLGPAIEPTHWVSVRTTWAFASRDIKSTPVVDLHLTSRVEAISETNDGLIEIRLGDRSAFAIPKPPGCLRLRIALTVDQHGLCSHGRNFAFGMVAQRQTGGAELRSTAGPGGGQLDRCGRRSANSARTSPVPRLVDYFSRPGD